MQEVEAWILQRGHRFKPHALALSCDGVVMAHWDDAVSTPILLYAVVTRVSVHAYICSTASGIAVFKLQAMQSSA